MASFDLETFLKVQGQTGVGAFGALGMAFGLPSCMLNLAQDVLSILPASVLGEAQGNILNGKKKANEVTRGIFKKLMLNTGIIEFDTDQGVFKFKSISSYLGHDNDNTQGLQNLGGLIGAFQYASSFGAQLYQNYTNITNEINAIEACFDKWNEMQSFQTGNSATPRTALSTADADELFDAVYAADKSKLNNIAGFLAGCDATLTSINSILLARENDPSLEPRLLDSSEFDPFLSGTNWPRFPLTDPGVDDEEEVFRLTYGPLLTTGGQYVLTSDGLYYDSQEGGLSSIYLAISGIVPPGDRWKYDYDPNLGGKGDAVSIESLNKFSENMFDPKLVDDSKGMQTYYDADHFLSVIVQQRDKHIYDLSSDLVSFIDTYGDNTAIVNNERQLIISELANHNSKIDRRKKQIEVAVKAPQIYGDADSPIFPPGEIPINDFSYLEGFNLIVGLEEQKALVFEEGEVEGMVYPINPIFTISAPKPPNFTFSHLNVPTIGKGSIIYTPSGTGSGTVLSLTDQVAAGGLFSIYNFLETKVVLPSSTDFFITNCATTDQYNNSKLVSTQTSSIFTSGLSIPYLEGIVKNKNTDTAAASALGSYIRLPDTSEFRDLTYSPSGFSLEFWAHVPNIMDGDIGWLSSTTSSLTKAVIACENVGVKDGVSAVDENGDLLDLDYLDNNRGGAFTRGLVCGFTRDRRITQESTGYSNSNALNDPVSSVSFFIAPTQARDASSASWINTSGGICASIPDFYKMKVDLSSNTSLGNVSSQFVLFDITVSPATNEVKFYIDGSVVATSAIDAVFGVEPYKTLNLPSFVNDNSFEYSSTTVDGPSTLHQGPRLNPFFTPWIIGGGYTDGMYTHGNFLGGGDRGGIVSSLRGHLGSLKFYSKPLTSIEISTNYKAQQGFFKTIIT